MFLSIKQVIPLFSRTEKCAIYEVAAKNKYKKKTSKDGEKSVRFMSKGLCPTLVREIEKKRLICK